MNRNYSALKQKADPPPYFMSYEITEQEYHVISASLGAITSNSGGKARNLDVSIRVGSPKLDNYHRVRGDRAQFTSGAAISVDDDPTAIGAASGSKPIAPIAPPPSGSSRSRPTRR